MNHLSSPFVYLNVDHNSVNAASGYTHTHTHTHRHTHAQIRSGWGDSSTRGDSRGEQKEGARHRLCLIKSASRRESGSRDTMTPARLPSTETVTVGLIKGPGKHKAHRTGARSVERQMVINMLVSDWLRPLKKTVGVSADWFPLKIRKSLVLTSGCCSVLQPHRLRHPPPPLPPSTYCTLKWQMQDNWCLWLQLYFAMYL